MSAAAKQQLFSDFERRYLRWPEAIDLPAWSEKYRYLSRRQSSRPGPWRNDTNPAVVGYMRILERPGVERVTVLKHSQGGWSEATRNFIGKKAHLEPDPFLVILPDKELGKSIITHRLMPLMQDTEVLKSLATGRRWDFKSNELVLAHGFVLRLGYSGSIGSVAAHPAKYVLCDERSKFQDNGLVSIEKSIEARTSTYEQSIEINLSTPGAQPDPTERLFDAAEVQLYYFIQCPHCGFQQELVRARLDWEPKHRECPDKAERAKRVLQSRSAWINCDNPKCAEVAPDGLGRIGESHQRALLLAGYWATRDQTWKLYNDGREEGEWGGWRTIGFHAPAFISLAPKHTWSRIASAWIEAEGDRSAERGIYNELFAEVYKPATVKTFESLFEKKCRPDADLSFTPPPQQRLPHWVSRLLLTIDTQKDRFYWVLRGWGHNFRSQRIHHGVALSFKELDDLLYLTRVPYEGDRFSPLPIYVAAIDSGGGIRRTDDYGRDSALTDSVYKWCLQDPARKKPIKGEGRKPQEIPHRLRRIDRDPNNPQIGRYTVYLWMIDSGYYEDLLDSYLRQQVNAVDESSGEVTDKMVDQWMLNDNNDPVYNKHLSNVEKQLIKTSRGKAVEMWVPSPKGARHDFRDNEVYQIAVAHSFGYCSMLASPAEVARQAAAAPPVMSGGVTMPDGRPFLSTQR